MTESSSSEKNEKTWNKAFLLHFYFILFIFGVVEPVNELCKNEKNEIAWEAQKMK